MCVNKVDDDDDDFGDYGDDDDDDLKDDDIGLCNILNYLLVGIS